MSVHTPEAPTRGIPTDPEHFDRMFEEIIKGIDTEFASLTAPLDRFNTPLAEPAFGSECPAPLTDTPYDPNGGNSTDATGSTESAAEVLTGLGSFAEGKRPKLRYPDSAPAEKPGASKLSLRAKAGRFVAGAALAMNMRTKKAPPKEGNVRVPYAAVAEPSKEEDRLQRRPIVVEAAPVRDEWDVDIDGVETSPHKSNVVALQPETMPAGVRLAARIGRLAARAAAAAMEIAPNLIGGAQPGAFGRRYA